MHGRWECHSNLFSRRPPEWRCAPVPVPQALIPQPRLSRLGPVPIIDPTYTAGCARAFSDRYRPTCSFGGFMSGEPKSAGRTRFVLAQGPLLPVWEKAVLAAGCVWPRRWRLRGCQVGGDHSHNPSLRGRACGERAGGGGFARQRPSQGGVGEWECRKAGGVRIWLSFTNLLGCLQALWKQGHPCLPSLTGCSGEWHNSYSTLENGKQVHKYCDVGSQVKGKPAPYGAAERRCAF